MWSLLLWILCSSMKGTENLPEWLAFLGHILLPHTSLTPVCILPHLIYIPGETMELCLVYRLEGQRLVEVWGLEQEHWEIQGVRGSLQMSRERAAKWSEKRWEYQLGSDCLRQPGSKLLENLMPAYFKHSTIWKKKKFPSNNHNSNSRCTITPRVVTV